MKPSIPSAPGTSQNSWATKAAAPISAGNPLFQIPLLWQGWALVYRRGAFLFSQPFVFVWPVKWCKSASPLAWQDGQEDARLLYRRGCLWRCDTFPYAGRGVTADQQRAISTFRLSLFPCHVVTQQTLSYRPFLPGRCDPDMYIRLTVSPGEHIFAVLCTFPLKYLRFKVFPCQ